MNRYLVAVCLFMTLILPSCGIPANIGMLTSQTVELSRNKGIEQQVVLPNCVYVVVDDFDLHERVVTLPTGCSLFFAGGCLRNGTLVGKDTYVVVRQSSPVFSEVMLKGTFVSSSFPINAYACKALDYFYSFLQAFSGTNLYLEDDYSVTKYLGKIEGTTPSILNIDGRGHKLSLYSFGAYKVEQCSIKDIVIDCRNNITPKNKWKSDGFNFGVMGLFEKSSLSLKNVTFTKECAKVYIRGFKELNITNCTEDGSYFFVYDCDNVSFLNNQISNAANGYYSIGRQTQDGKIRIENNTFRNISGGGIILSGGLKYNVSIVNNILENVGGGGAMSACINIHPWGKNKVNKNTIIANKGAVTLDIDAARDEMFNEKTTVEVKKNVIKGAAGDISLHGMALVGLGNLDFRNNTITDQQLYFWDTPYMKFYNNKISYSKGFDANTSIGKMSTHELTENIEYKHYYKNNVVDIPYAKSYVKFEYLSKAKVRINGKRNKYSHPVSFVDQYKQFEVKGDIIMYH